MENQVFYYAGFWRRFVAYIIDELLVGAVTFIILLPLYIIFGVGIFAFEDFEGYENFSNVIFTQYYDDDVKAGFIIAVIFFALIIAAFSIILQWLYYALMESSSKQATLGKMALGIKVTDLEGKRITFGRATGRYFGKILSGLILNIGYIMAAFTERKQALHDMMANCLVIINPPIYQQNQRGYNEVNQNTTST